LCWTESGDDSDGGGLRTLVALNHLELDLLVLLQVAEPIAADLAEMHEHVGTFLWLDETEALLGTEPLDGASCHCSFPPFLAACELPSFGGRRSSAGRGNCSGEMRLLNPHLSA